MRVKTERYEQIARMGVRWAVKEALRMKSEGMPVLPISEWDGIIGNTITEEEVEGFTEYNDKKAQRFIDREIELWKTGKRHL